MVPAAVADRAMPAFDREIDVRGLSCPMPALRARAALRSMKAGQVLRVVATDSGAPRDFATFARATGNVLVAQTDSGREMAFYLRKKKA
jgi:tRNA 2-thiouridine synthesizing protein A